MNLACCYIHICQCSYRCASAPFIRGSQHFMQKHVDSQLWRHKSSFVSNANHRAKPNNLLKLSTRLYFYTAGASWDVKLTEIITINFTRRFTFDGRWSAVIVCAKSSILVCYSDSLLLRVLSNNSYSKLLYKRHAKSRNLNKWNCNIQTLFSEEPSFTPTRKCFKNCAQAPKTCTAQLHNITFATVVVFDVI